MRLASLFLVLCLTGGGPAPTRPAYTQGTDLAWVSAWCGVSLDDDPGARALCLAMRKDVVLAWECTAATKEEK